VADYRAAAHTQSRPTQSKQAAATGPLIAADQPVKNVGMPARVVDDFPEAIPVTARELEVIETYLGAALDQYLGGELEQQIAEKPLASVRMAAKMNADCKSEPHEPIRPKA
jgi:hypothetical protein